MERERKYKDITRQMAASFSPRQSALYLPAAKGKCFLTAEQMGMISKENTHLFLVERNPVDAERLTETVNQAQWANVCRHNGELHNFVIPSLLDYAWVDLNGTVGSKLADWFAHQLSPNLMPGAVFCLTMEYCWRNNTWLKSVREDVMNNHEMSYVDFRFKKGVLKDKYIAFPAFLIACLLREWRLEFLEPYRYYDTIDMMFYRVIVTERQKPVLPMLASHPQPEPQGVRTMKVPTSKEVIEALVAAHEGSPATKAHATRKLKTYVADKVSEGKNPVQIAAAIKAHVTRRLMKAAC
jgi:hypothetical protein